MSDRLVHTLVRMSERGQPRGAASVLAEARQRVTAPVPQRPPRPQRRGLHPALAVAAVLLVTIGGLVVLQMLRSDSTPTDDPTPATTTPPTTSAPSTTALVPGAADDVSEVALAPDGSLWAATAAGVVEWDLGTRTPTVHSEADGLGSRSVTDVAIGPDGTVWAVGDSWLASYDGAWTVAEGDLPSDRLTPTGDLAVGPDGAAWVASEDGALFRIDDAGTTTFEIPEQFRYITEPWTRSLAVDPDGTVWAAMWRSGVLAFDGEWQHFGVDDGLPSDLVGNVTVAPDGSVWIGGEGSYGDPGGDIPAAGVVRYHDGTWTTYTTADGLLGNDGDVTIDPTGGVWVVHQALPDNVAAALGVELPVGISYFDGSEWRQYAGIGGRGPSVATADRTLWLPSPQGITGFDGRATTHLTVGPERVPAPPPAESVVLEPADGIEPVRLSTSIGEIEFTTWIFPDDESPPLHVTGTDHGVIGDLPPDGTPAWSLDGITWTEINLSLEATGWSDQTEAYGDDLYAFVDRGVARLSWNGRAWVEAETLTAPRAYRGAAGPAGIVVVDGEQVHYWDGEQFTEASRPPDKTLHPGSAGCRAPGWVGGIMAQLGPIEATGSGFIALAARGESDWQRDPTCEPLVWLSPDGDVWALTSDESPFDDGAFAHDLIVIGDRILMAGGVSPEEGAVWISDDGIAWERADLDAAQLWHVAGSDRGWIAVGNHESNLSAELRGDMWFSPDGLVWDGPYARPASWADATGIVGVAMFDDLIVGTGERLDFMPEGSAGVIVGRFIEE